MTLEIAGSRGQAEHASPEDLPESIGKEGLQPTRLAAGETQIILERHGEYVRNRDDARAGSLTESAEASEAEAAEEYFEGLFAKLTPDEWKTVDILVVASDTQYFDGGRRSYETASIAQQAAVRVLARHGLSSAHVLPSPGTHNNRDKPWIMQGLREPQMFIQSPDFVDFLQQRHGDMGEFWKAYEEDEHEEERLAHLAEGPDDIASRAATSVRQLAAYAHAYHKANPGRRLAIWAATHYDTISPYVRRDILGLQDWKKHYLGVEYGGGIAINIDSHGNSATANIGGKRYRVPERLIVRQDT